MTGGAAGHEKGVPNVNCDLTENDSATLSQFDEEDDIPLIHLSQWNEDDDVPLI